MEETLAIAQRGCNVVGFLLILTAIQWGGFPSSANPANEAPPSTRQKLSDTLDKNIASAKKERQEFEQYLREQFHDLEDKVQALREKGTELHETTKSNLNEKLENLKEQKKAILSKIENLRNSSENAWKDIRENILNTMNDIEQSLSQSSKSH